MPEPDSALSEQQNNHETSSLATSRPSTSRRNSSSRLKHEDQPADVHDPKLQTNGHSSHPTEAPLGLKRKFDAISKSDKKPKPPSPPWKRPDVEGPTALVVDGRRKSARTHPALAEKTVTETPTKRPKTTNISPPWKEPGAHGPTAIIADGRRKSLRTNTLPSPHAGHPDVENGTRHTSPPWKDFKAEGPTSVMVAGRRRSTRARTGELEMTPEKKKPGRPRKSSNHTPLSSPEHRHKPHLSHNGTFKVPASKSGHTSRNSIPSRHSSRVTASDAQEIHFPQSPSQRGRARSTRTSLISNDEPTPYVKLKLRVRDHPPVLQQHPRHFPTNKTEQSFQDWLQNDDSLEGETQSTPNHVKNEAAMRLRIVNAAENDGVLSDARCTRFAFEPFAEPQSKYGHWSFVANHAIYFSSLRSKEVRAHKAEASRIARQVQLTIQTDSKWAFLRQARSPEELEKEKRDLALYRHKQTVKDISVKWNMVRHEVNRVKLVQWEKEQDLLGKKHLDEMLDKSTHLLNQQFRDSSADGMSETVGSRYQSVVFDDSENVTEHLAGESSAVSGASDDENLSSSEDDEEGDELDDPDLNLSPEALARKYQAALAQESLFTDESDTESNEANSEDEVHSIEESLRAVHTDVASDLDDAAESTIGIEDFSAYTNLEMEEVAPELLDDSDEESTDMSDDIGVSDEEQEYDSEDDSRSDSVEMENKYSGLAALYVPEEPRSPSVTFIDEALECDDSASIAQQDHDMAPTSEKASELNQSAASTPTPEDDAVVSTPTTSIVPGTPRNFRTEVSPLLRGTLREYQHDGVDWLAQLYAGGRNGILADEMGLGKTIQTIALLAHLATYHEVWGPHLVVVPTSVMLNWEMEFKKWCPAFRILTYYGDINERKRKRKGWNNDDMWNVCITSYNIILQDQQVFKRRGWHYLVLDEAHNIKNFQSQRWQTLLTFRTHSRLLLTGTPLQNNLQELWSLLYFLMPAGVDGSGFADLEKFLNSMKRPADQILDQGRQELDPEAQARVHKLHEILRPFLLRRLKSEVEKQMPSKYEHVVYCRLSKRQRQLYDEFMGRADTKQTLSLGNYMSVINCLMSLRKVCNHPDLFETRQIVTSFAMPKSVVANYEVKELLIRKRLLESKVLDFDFSGLLPVAHEKNSKRHMIRLAQLQAAKQLENLAAQETKRLEALQSPSGRGSLSVVQQFVIEAQKNAVRELRDRAEHVKRVVSRKPIYGNDLVEILTIPGGFEPPQPSKKKPDYTHGLSFLDKCTTLSQMLPTVEEVSARTTSLVTKFGCVTPAVVAEDLTGLTLTRTGVETIQLAQSRYPIVDPYHESRIRLSIAFPDKRLLQYDCGKLQALDRLLRELQAGGHRCLIFTQMTKVLDILEQFLNIHGHRYLRLDGATKVEQRQILTDRFNQDNRILAFILSSRSGGLGINLTGADTVIFYDLDWNPAMDKQCQDRCHRIGQTRDVHIYRFVSEYTIEANILRKSNQKRLLDDVIIQRGEFTTDMFQRVTYRDAIDGMLADENQHSGADAEASAAVDKFLGNITELGDVLDNVEDKEDAAAAKVASKENVVNDDIDFDENAKADQQEAMAANPNATLDESGKTSTIDAYGQVPPQSLDDYLVRFMTGEMKYDPIKLPKQLKPVKGVRKTKGR